MDAGRSALLAAAEAKAGIRNLHHAPPGAARFVLLLAHVSHWRDSEEGDGEPTRDLVPLSGGVSHSSNPSASGLT